MNEFLGPETPEQRTKRYEDDLRSYISRESGIANPIDLERHLALYKYTIMLTMREYKQIPDPTKEVLQPGFNLEEAVWDATQKGYYFAHNAITSQACHALANEISSLDLELGDHIAYPIWPGTKREVRQLHERFYTTVWDPRVPAAKSITETIASEVEHMTFIDPVLSKWFPNEVGYQRYRSSDDWISPHRDRRNDQILALTITISGSADVLVFEPIDDPDDYTNLRIIDEFKTTPGSVMFLRAPGLDSGKQIIHEVRPPEIDSRLILNLRMRPDILPPPEAV